MARLTYAERQRLPIGEVFHAPDAHYCLKCEKWYADKDVKK